MEHKFGKAGTTDAGRLEPGPAALSSRLRFISLLTFAHTGTSSTSNGGMASTRTKPTIPPTRQSSRGSIPSFPSRALALAPPPPPRLAHVSPNLAFHEIHALLTLEQTVARGVSLLPGLAGLLTPAPRTETAP